MSYLWYPVWYLAETWQRILGEYWYLSVLLCQNCAKPSRKCQKFWSYWPFFKNYCFTSIWGNVKIPYSGYSLLVKIVKTGHLLKACNCLFWLWIDLHFTFYPYPICSLVDTLRSIHLEWATWRFDLDCWNPCSLSRHCSQTKTYGKSLIILWNICNLGHSSSKLPLYQEKAGRLRQLDPSDKNPSLPLLLSTFFFIHWHHSRLQRPGRAVWEKTCHPEEHQTSGILFKIKTIVVSESEQTDNPLNCR